MAANTKKKTKGKSRSRKKKKSSGNSAVIIIVSLILAIIVVLAFIFRDKISEKIQDYGPNVFMTTDYEEYVLKYSKEYEMDPRFIFAIINTESHFNPDATSNVGARGLMQLMEEAYDWVKFRMGDERPHTFDEMYDPELNIQYGTFMLKFLYEKFDHSYELTAAAYHGGMNAVDTWINDGTVDPDNFRLEDVPSDVTANYIYKVMNAYNKYKEKLEEDFKNG
ncbi:soluble lytic murein transglycosylase [Ruminococcaceae bacterium FB2012]|nr:soluble lytic murein transglycosylase [Ruminococcaceae bacterium FB2012]